METYRQTYINGEPKLAEHRLQTGATAQWVPLPLWGWGTIPNRA